MEKNVNIDEKNNVVGKGEVNKNLCLAKFGNKEKCLRNMKCLHPSAGICQENIESNGAQA